MSHYQKAFTLIELLVTVAVIGILASFAVAQYSEYRSKAYDAVAISSIKNARMAAEALFSDRPDIGMFFASFYGTQPAELGCYILRPEGGFYACPANYNIFPGFTQTEGVNLSFSYNSGGYNQMYGARSVYIRACHCKGTTTGQGDYPNAAIDYVDQNGHLEKSGPSVYCSYNC